MAKINLKTLKKDEVFNYFETTVDEIWTQRKVDTKIYFSDERTNMKMNKNLVKKRISSINQKLGFVEENKQLIAENIIENNFFSMIDESKEKMVNKPFKAKKNKDFFTHLENFVKTKLKKVKTSEGTFYSDCNDSIISFPITKEQFVESLGISDIEIFLEEKNLEINLQIRCIPDYFAEYYLNLHLDNENNITVVSFIYDDGFDDEFDDDYEDDIFYDDGLYPVETGNEEDIFAHALKKSFLESMMNFAESEEVIKKFIEKINSHNMRSISALMLEDFIYIDSDGFRDKADAKEEFKNIFSIFPDYKIEILEISMGEIFRAFVYCNISGTYYGQKAEADKYSYRTPAVFVVNVFNKKIKSLEVFHYGKFGNDFIKTIENL